MTKPVFALGGLIIKKHSRTFSTLLPNVKNIDNGCFFRKEFKTKQDCLLYLEEIMGEARNSDNMRHCASLNEFQLDEYLVTYSKGCCGFYDELIYINPTLNEKDYDLKHGEPWLIGYNYNH